MANKHCFHIVILVVAVLVECIGISAKAEETGTGKFSAGAWRGNIRMGSVDVGVELHVTENSDHSYAAKMDIPNAGRKNVPIDEFKCNGDEIKLSIKNLIDFTGKLNQRGNTFSGNWIQAGKTFTVTFTKSTGAVTASKVRPQDPKPPYPYREEEVTVEQKRDGLKLSGTLCLPALTDKTAKAPYPAVLFLRLAHRERLVQRLQAKGTRQGIR